MPRRQLQGLDQRAAKRVALGCVLKKSRDVYVVVVVVVT